MNKTKQSTLQAINSAISSLKQQGIKQTQKRVSEVSGLSIATIKRHWKGINRVSLQEVKRVSIQGDTKPKQGDTDSDFERFRRRKPSGNIQINPWDL